MPPNGARLCRWLGVDLDGGDPFGPDGVIDGGRAATLEATRQFNADGTVTVRPFDHVTVAGDGAGFHHMHRNRRRATGSPSAGTTSSARSPRRSPAAPAVTTSWPWPGRWSVRRSGGSTTATPSTRGSRAGCAGKEATAEFGDFHSPEAVAHMAHFHIGDLADPPPSARP